MRLGAAFDSGLPEAATRAWAAASRAAEASSLSSVPVGRVAPGTHRVAARVTRRGEVVYSTEAEFVKHPLPRVYATAGGPIMVEGRPFLPMGWYHVSWPFSSEERLAFLRDIHRYTAHQLGDELM